jgi:hypothetical protein
VLHKSHRENKRGKRTNNIGSCTHSKVFSVGHPSLTWLHSHLKAQLALLPASALNCNFDNLHGNIHTMKTYYSRLVFLWTWPSPSCSSIFSRGPRIHSAYNSTEYDRKSNAQRSRLDKSVVIFSSPASHDRHDTTVWIRRQVVFTSGAYTRICERSHV